MTEIRDQSDECQKSEGKTMNGNARGTERFPCVLFAMVVKPISDPDF